MKKNYIFWLMLAYFMYGIGNHAFPQTQTGDKNLDHKNLSISNLTDNGKNTNEKSGCEAVTAYPYSESYYNFNLPNCWTNEYVSGTSDWNIKNIAYHYNNNSSSGNNYQYHPNLYFKHSPEGNVTKLVVRELNLSNLNLPMVAFKYKQENYQGNHEQLKLYYKTSETDAWQLLKDYTDATTGLVQERVYLPNKSETYFVAFEGTAKGGNGLFLENDIVVKEIAPEQIEVTDITTTSVQLNWQDNELISQWKVEYGPEGFTPGSAEGNVVTITTNPYQLTGLDVGTDYDCYITSIYNNSMGTATKKHFTTKCNILEVNDFFYNDFSNNVSNCWELEGGWYWSQYYNCMRISGSGTGKLVLPVMDLTGLTNPTLSFHLSLSSSSCSYNVLYKLHENDTWTVIPNDESQVNVPLPETQSSSTYYIAFEATVTSYYSDVYLYHVGVGYNQPLNPRSEDVKVNSAVLSWEDVAEANTWEIEYGVKDFILGSGTVVTTTSSTGFLLSELGEKTTYDWYVRSVRANGAHSNWSNKASFATLCNAPVTDFPFLLHEDNECWWQEFKYGTQQWNLNNTTASFGYSNNNNIYAYKITKLVLPVMDLTGIINPSLQFKHTKEYSFSTLKIYYKTHEDDAWTLLPTQPQNHVGSYMQENFLLPNPNDTYYIAFEGEVMSRNSYIYLDSIYVKQPESGVLAPYQDQHVFENTTVGNTDSFTVTLTNQGAAPLVINQVNLAGDNATDFSITATMPQTIGVNDTYSFDVTFQPTIAGYRTADLVIVDDTTTHTIALSGKALPTENQQMISLEIQQTVGSTIWLTIDAEEVDQPNIWIDLNNNGVKDYAEDEIEFNSYKGYIIQSPVISIYGNVTFLSTGNNTLTVIDASEANALITLRSTGNEQLQRLDVSNATALTTLDCYDSQLKTLDVSGATALTSLNCYNNRLESLDVSGATALTSLNCYNNRLEHLDVSGATALTSLNCYDNRLENLDVSGATALTSLNCYDNRLENLDVSGATALTSLNCYNNRLEHLDVSGAATLTSLSCGDNRLEHLDVSGATALTGLHCSDNRLEHLDVSGTTTLEYLNCSDNQLQDLDVSGATALTDIHFNDNPLISVNVSGTKIDALYFYNMPTLTTLIANHMPELTSLSCYNNALQSISLSDNPKLESLRCYNNQLQTLDVSNATALKYLNCYNNQLQTLDISGATALNTLNCYNNQLQTLGISGTTALNTLNCSNNQLQTLDISGATALIDLDCSNNQLQTFDLSQASALQVLNLNYNELQTLDIFGATSLQKLYCKDNQLTNLDVSDATTLGVLAFENNPLVSFNISGTGFGYFTCENIPTLTTLIADNMANLYSLSCANNALQSISISNNPNLHYLYCYNNQLESLDVSNNLELYDLYCYNNQLQTLNISGNTWLKKLDCSGNRLTSLDISTSLSIEKLYCFGNALTDINLTEDNNRLRFIYCADNFLEACDLDKLYTRLPSRLNLEIGEIQIKANSLSNPGAATCNTSIATAKNWNVTDYNTSFEGDGTGCETPQCIITPAYCHLGATQTQTLTRQIEVTNAGTATLVVSGITISATHADCFSLNTTGFEVPVSSTYSFTVTFTPHEAGMEIAHITLIDNTFIGSHQLQVTAKTIDESGEDNAPIVLVTQKIPGQSIYLTMDADVEEQADVWIDLNNNGIKETEESDVYFDDDNGRNYLLQSSIVTIYGNIKSLDCYKYYYSNLITDIDIQHAVKLQTLNCRDNQLDVLKITDVPLLTGLNCSDNQLQSLDISGATALTDLNCSYNQLQMLDVSNATTLTSLYCSGNQLYMLDISGATALTDLSCSSNPLVSLNISETKLDNFSCNNMSTLTTLTAENMTELTALSCYNNALQSLTIANVPVLTSLNCKKNQLQSLNFSDIPSLTSLDCRENQLQSLDLSETPSLTRLYCQVNQLQNLDIYNNMALEILDCSNNQLPHILLQKDNGLRYIKCYGNLMEACALDSLYSFLPNTGGEIYIEYNSTTNSNPGAYTSNTSIATAKDWVVKKSNYDALEGDGTGCHSAQCGVTPRDAYYFGHTPVATQLTKDFTISNGGSATLTISEITFSGVGATSYSHHEDLPLHIPVGSSYTLTVSFLPTVTGALPAVMTIKNNTIIGEHPIKLLGKVLNDVTDENMPIVIETYKDYGEELQFYISAEEADQADVWIDINNNGIKEEEEQVTSFGYHSIYIKSKIFAIYGKITSLESYSYYNSYSSYYNHLKTIDASDAKYLKTLDANKDRYSKQKIDLSGATALITVDCYNSNITDLILKDNTQLTTLKCSYNQLKTLDVSGYNTLTTLQCNHNQLTELNISGVSQLTYLPCYDNQLTTIHFSNNESLTTVDCYNNQLTELDVSNLTNLQTLNCYNNQLTALNVFNNSQLTALSCYGNNMDACALNELYVSLPDWSASTSLYPINVHNSNSETNPGAATSNTGIANIKRWLFYNSFSGDATGCDGLHVAVNPPSNDFGHVKINHTKEQLFTCTNPGSEDIIVSNIQLTGANSDEFFISNTYSGTIVPANIVDFSVAFTPNSEGVKSATIEISYQDDQTFSIPISGHGVCEFFTDVPTISVDNQCRQSVLTASNYSGTLTWSTGETTESITVEQEGLYSVYQTISGCTSMSAEKWAFPKATPDAPSISETQQCGQTILTAYNYSGDLTWSTGETTESIAVEHDGYTYSVTQTVDGCESNAASIQAMVYAIYDETATETICASEVPYVFGMQQLYESGTYSETFQTINGCDSLVTLNLTVNPTYDETVSQTICSSAVPYPFGDLQIEESGTYSQTFETINGCDSLVTLNLTIIDAFDEEVTQIICASETPYPFGTQQLYESGTYTETFQTIHGCDSLVTLNLTVHPIYDETAVQTICASEAPYIFGMQQLYESGTYSETFQTINGCDSLVTLNLTVKPTYDETVSQTICSSAVPYPFGDLQIEESGTYSQTFETVHGCDSLVTLNLTIIDAFDEEVTQTICASETPYPFGAQQLYKSGTYTETFQTIHGCDSLVTLNLTVHPIYDETAVQTICDSEAPYVFGMQQLYESGTYSETFQTINGCDSLVTLNLTVNPTYDETVSQTICSSAVPYPFGDLQIEESGTYSQTFETINGCDSLVTLNVTIIDVFDEEVTQIICASETPYPFGTQQLYESGTYTETFQTIQGCDSLVTLNLTVHPIYDETAVQTICDSEAPYVFGMQQLYESGTYSETFQTINGCDSLVTLNLTVNPTYDETVSQTICSSAVPYPFGDLQIEESGTYSQTFETINGCDSLVTLNVTIIDVFDEEVTQIICASETPYPFGTQQLYESGTYTETFQTIQGCDSLVTLNLTVHPIYDETAVQTICASEAPYIFGMQQLYESGTYSETFQTINGCDSLVTLNLTVNPTYDETVNQTICANNLPYLFGDLEITEAGTYSQTFETIHGCDSLVTLNLDIWLPDTPQIINIAHPTILNAYGSFEIENYNEDATYVVEPNENVTQNGAVFSAMAGTYTVTASVDGCVSEASAPVIINEQPIGSYLDINVTSHDFGDVIIEEHATKDFVITNLGSGDLVISSIDFEGNHDGFSQTGGAVTISSGEDYTFTVTFAPETEGLHTAMMAIANNSATPTVEISLMGVGVANQQEAVWQGDESEDWFTAENWDINAIPEETTNVIIPSELEVYPTITAPATCKNITFEQGATLLGFEMLTVVENAFFHQFLTGGENSIGKDSPDAIYHYVSAPVANPTAGSVFPLSAYLRQYNETTQDWGNLLAEDIMEVGKGYNLWIPEGDENVTYQGALNQEAITFNGLTLTDEFDNYSGWHLLGNPYPAGIDANELEFSDEIQHGISVWNSKDGTYVTWNGMTGNLTGDIIPVGQGFFIKVNQNNANFSISPEACVHSNVNVYKGIDANAIAINVKNNENQYNETAFVAFTYNGNNDYDQFDIIKLDGLNTAPAIYTKINDKRISINSRYSAYDVPLYFNTNVPGTFTLKITDFNLSDDITIEDTFTGVSIPAELGATYDFTANADDDTERFVIHFNGFIDIDEEQMTVNVYADRQRVVVNNQTGLEAEIMLYNISGQLIETVRTTDIITRMDVVAKGIYFVTVRNSKATQTEKVFVK